MPSGDRTSKSDGDRNSSSGGISTTILVIILLVMLLPFLIVGGIAYKTKKGISSIIKDPVAAFDPDFESRKIGESCKAHSNCIGHGTNPTDVACCGMPPNQTCQRKIVVDGNPLGQCPGGTQGSRCVLDSDCAGWSMFGNVKCLNNACVTMGQVTPSSGGSSSGGSSCIVGQRAGGEACIVDSDCPCWTVTGPIACCKNKCTTKTGLFCP